MGNRWWPPQKRKSRPSSFKLALKPEDQKDSQKNDTTPAKPKSKVRFSEREGQSPGPNTFGTKLGYKPILKTEKHSSPPQGTLEWLTKDTQKKMEQLNDIAKVSKARLESSLALFEEGLKEKMSKSKMRSTAPPPIAEDRATTVGQSKVLARPPLQPVEELHSKEEKKEPKHLVGTPPTRNVQQSPEDTPMSGDKSVVQSGCSTKRRLVAKLSDKFEAAPLSNRLKSQTKVKQSTDTVMKDSTKDINKTPPKKPKVKVTIPMRTVKPVKGVIGKSCEVEEEGTVELPAPKI